MIASPGTNKALISNITSLYIMLSNYQLDENTYSKSGILCKMWGLLTNKKPQVVSFTVGAQRGRLYLLDGLIDGSKCRLLVIMVNSPVTMENEDTFLISLLTVAAIDTVVWTVVPLAGEHIEAFCKK